MSRAMETRDVEPVIIEDLVRIGEDLGLERGQLEMAREELVAVVESHHLALTDEQRARIQAEESLPRLRIWLRAVASATSVDDLLSLGA
jgi:hypothetical protein